jgi:hypothetical protein
MISKEDYPGQFIIKRVADNNMSDICTINTSICINASNEFSHLLTQYQTLLSCIEIIEDGEEPQAGDMIKHGGSRGYRVDKVDGNIIYHLGWDWAGKPFSLKGGCEIIQRNNRPCILRSAITTSKEGSHE